MTVQKIFHYDLTYTYKLGQTREGMLQAYDETHAAAAVQGIVNRRGPCLYLRFITHNGVNVDDFWLEKLMEAGAWLEGAKVETVHSLDELLSIFRKDINGVVVWDPRVPATSNVASTVAGAESLIPVRYDPSPSSLYTRLIADQEGPLLPVIRSLVNPDGSSIFTGTGTVPGTDIPSTGSAKCDAYVWAKVHYLDTGRSNAEVLGYYLDSFFLESDCGDPQHHLLTNHDYVIAHKGFFFDLSPWADECPNDDPTQPLGTDYQTTLDILNSAYSKVGPDGLVKVLGFTPWRFKYTDITGGKYGGVPTEWKFVEILSAFNAYVEADAADLDPMANASFYQHYPLPAAYPTQIPPERSTLKNRGFLDDNGNIAPFTYIALYAGDYDSPAWLYRWAAVNWDDPERGEAPISWAFNPNLLDRVPMAMDFVRCTASENDMFVAGDSGAGYINPGMLTEPRPISNLPSGLGAWSRHNETYYRRWGITATGFIIWGNGPVMDEEAFGIYRRFSTHGVGANAALPTGIRYGIPQITVRDLPDEEPERQAHDLAESYRLKRDDEPDFHMYRTILKSPAWLNELSRELQGQMKNIRIVDAYTLFALIRIHSENQRNL